jgi:hypothetical protein
MKLQLRRSRTMSSTGLEGENKYDSIGIGWGAKSVPELRPLFEGIVNFIRENSPGSKLLFNQSPNDLLEPVTRQFPVRSKTLKE